MALKKASSAALVQKLARPITIAQQKFLEASVTITQEPDAVERAYMARELIQCTLPHSDPGDVPIWKRTNGALTLVIGANSTEKGRLYPYGSIPRLLLFWVTSEALLTKKRRLELGRNLAQFMKDIGLDPKTGRGKRGDAKRVREQMFRLFRSTISFQIDHTQDPKRHGFGWLDMQVAPEGEMWWDPKRPDQSNLWESWIELGEKFYQAITAAPVPCDLRALKALKKSPLALDLYAWATHKAYTAAKTGKSQRVPWVALQRQFGTDYRRSRDFKTKAIAALKKICAVYTGLHLEFVDGELVVLASSLPAVPAKFTGIL